MVLHHPKPSLCSKPTLQPPFAGPVLSSAMSWQILLFCLLPFPHFLCTRQQKPCHTCLEGFACNSCLQCKGIVASQTPLEKAPGSQLHLHSWQLGKSFWRAQRRVQYPKCSELVQTLVYARTMINQPSPSHLDVFSLVSHPSFPSKPNKDTNLALPSHLGSRTAGTP